MPAGAATGGSLCFQIKDGSGDSSFNGAPLAPASLDILSADIATGSNNLVAVLRLKSLTREPYQSTGTSYTFTFTLGGTKQTLAYAISATGTVVSTYTPGGPSTTVSAKSAVDSAAGTITWTLPRRSVAGLKTKGASLSGLAVAATSTVHVENGGSEFNGGTVSDDASTGKAYRDGTKTCLKGV
jgi:hypothetical protein